ncbi:MULTISPECIES: HNH endonuclease signature motif containing protein [Rhizobium]|nr:MULTISPECIES: HNH endonuclease signature motif containing protein [Rhizobium]MCA0801843.1 HNH endonuclease [Rhizobium sp. T1473]MCS0463536.1 HNH endonuclease [Rhizobium favelukesii]UFS84185.1 HNH endonuclease [Rhizobium sp. T136]
MQRDRELPNPDGGKDDRDNFAAACKSCNDSRGKWDWLSYASLKRDEFF